MLKAIHADITTLEVDAIVNAANESLLGGGGVDGAIHRAAGPELLRTCRGLGRCPTGEARITPGFNLPVKHVIHTVGPVYQDGSHEEAALLASCYRNSLELAKDNGIKTIAFPGISTGVYGYPKEEAATIAVTVCREFENDFDEIIFCCFSEADKDRYEGLLGS
jgi:O-acetyl-ADP-ribose deacetylase (regulator of RNase III)